MKKFYDLFCGIGGFRLGIERAFKKTTECIGSCEINEYARKIYSKNFGELPSDKDVRLVDPSELPDFDLLTAGFPCQAFSYAGKRMGFDDNRGNLFFEIIRIVQEKRPTAILLENVRGLLSHDSGNTFGRIIYEMDKLGYDIEWQVINGKYFVPQNRERVFIIGHDREKPFRQVFPIGTVCEVIDESFKKTQREGERISGQYIGCLDANYWKGGGTRTMLRDCSSVQLANSGMNGRRIKDPDDPSWCIDSVGSVGVMVNSKIRKLTPLECERLMGFPDGWTEGLSDTQRYKCLGNSVIPQIVTEIVKYI